MFTKEKFLSLTCAAQHKKIAELIKKVYFEFDLGLYHHILKLESYLNLCWTKGVSKEELSVSFHKHWSQTQRGISEHNLLIQTQDRSQPLKPSLDIVVCLDQLRSAQNIGNIIRTTEAFQLGRICFANNMADMSHPLVQKTAMGACQWVESQPFHLDELPRPIIALETHEKATPIQRFTFPKSFTLVLGNEEFGVSKNMLEQADEIVQVELAGRKNSLNVSSCFAILAWKIDQDLRSGFALFVE